jgi:hypothetical protein
MPQALPRAVREQAERAEALHQQLLAAQNTGVEPTPAPAPVEASVEAPEPAPAPAPAEAAAPASNVADADQALWKNKYDVLNGKYVAERRRDRERIQELEQQLQAQHQSAAPAPAPAPDNSLAAATEKYGEEFAQAVETIAAAKSKQLTDALASKVEKVEASAAEVARSTFMRDLGARVPNWSAIDADPGFTAYLDTFMPETGRTRREFFNEADATNDAARIAGFFLGYSRSKTAAPAPAPVAAPAPAPAPSVDHLLAPDSSRASVPDTSAGKKQWTVREAVQFYADARAKKYTPADFARIDRDITLAQQQGRMRP